MNVGDLVSWQEQLWLVRNVEDGLCLAESPDGVVAMMAQDMDAAGLCSVVCNPIRDWPSVTLPVKSRSRLVGVLNGHHSLVRFQDWVKIDEFQMGGLLLLNPRLSLGFRDRLTLVFSFAGNRRLERTPIEIPRSFSSLTSKITQRDAPTPKLEPKPAPTFYDALLSEDDVL